MSLDKSVVETLEDHEERIDELEQNGGGGGGTPDRIESASGDAFAEATDDFLEMGTSAVLSRVNHSSGSAIAYTAILPGEGGSSQPVLMASIAAANADETQSAGIGAAYDPTTDQFSLGAFGAPLRVEEPTESNHAATKGYVDDRYVVEWWEPDWTPVNNVDSVSNVECQYTRTYRAAGGSLVTLEGTVEVTPEALADDSLIFSCPLPVPQDGSTEILGWAGDTENRPGSMCAISGGELMVIIESVSDAVRTASFRISYRAV